MTSPSISFLVVTYNAARSLCAALESILPQDYPATLIEIIVVDNASRDGTPALIQTRFPQVKLVCQAVNVGFAQGINLAAQHSQGEWLALINPDVTLNGDWLKEIIVGVESDPAIGAAGGKLYFGDGQTISSVGGTLHANGLTAHRGAFEQDRGQYVHISDVDYVTGATMLIRRDVWTQLSGFDAGFFMYYEDVDFCLRARQSGYRAVYVPGAVALHHEDFSTAGRRGLSPRYLWHYHRSRYRFMRKHGYPIMRAEIVYLAGLLRFRGAAYTKRLAQTS